MKEKDVQNSMLNQRSYIWISALTLHESFSASPLASVHRLFFSLHVLVMTSKIGQK